jgi:tetratricopeptide (TPR) repeat protein
MSTFATSTSRILILGICLATLVAAPFAAQEPDPAEGTGAAEETDPAGAAGPTPPGEAATASPRADLSEASALIRESSYAEAEEVLTLLQVDFPDDPALLLMRGEILLALGRAGEALEPLRRSAEIDPERPRVHFQLATAFSATGDPQAAITAFGTEFEHNEDSEIRALALLNRSMLLQQQKKWTDAGGELERLLELQPERTQVYGDLATVYVEAGRLGDAAAALDRGATAGFQSSAHYYSLGARLYRDEDYEESVRMLQKALEIEPRMARAERSLGAALERLDRIDEAVEHLSRYLELAPDAPDAERVAEQIRAARGK